MTKRQRDRAIKLLKADCQIVGELMDNEGKTCAIGCLALYSGISKRTLQRTQGSIVNSDRPMRRVSNAIRNQFGLDIEAQQEIQHINDSNYIRRDRVKSVISYVRAIAKAK